MFSRWLLITRLSFGILHLLYILIYMLLTECNSGTIIKRIVVVILCVFVLLCVHCCSFTLDAGLLARSQFSEGPATGHLDTSFSWFPCAYKQMLRWFPRFKVATKCFSCSPPDLNLVVTNFMFSLHVK